VAENYELNVNVDGVNECIDALDSAKDILDGCQADVDDKVALINCLPHGNAGNLILSVEPFDALDISNLQYQLHSVLDQIEDYNRANSSGEGNWFSNLFGGIAQGGVGVLEGIADGFASIVLDIGDACNVSGEWENGLANWIKEDWSYKAGYAVGNGLSGGKGYDENSGWAVAGKITGTMVTYGAISCIPGLGGVVADVAIGGLSGYGQGTQKALRKQGIQTESEWSNTLNNETVGRSDAVSKKAVSNSKGTATVEAFKGAGTALLANGLFKLGGKAISKVKGKGVSATSGLDDAAEGGLTGKVTKSNDKIAEMLNKNADEIIDGAGKSANGVKSAASKVDDAANAADDAASAVSKADDTFRESGQKLVDAQTELDKGYKSGKSEYELGNLEEKRDIAKKAFSDAGGDSQELMNAVSEKVNASNKLKQLGDRADAPSDLYYFNQLDEGINKITTANNKIDQLLEKTDGAAKFASKSADDVAGASAVSKADDTFRESGQKLVDAQTKLDEGLSKKAAADSKISQLLGKTDGAAKSASKSADDVAGAAGDSVSKSLFRKLINKDSVILTIADKATSRKVDFPTTSNDSSDDTTKDTSSNTSGDTTKDTSSNTSGDTTKGTSSNTSDDTTKGTSSNTSDDTTGYTPSGTHANSQFRKSGDEDSTSSTTAPPSTTSTTAPPSTTSTTAPPSTSSTTAPPSTSSTTAPSSTTSTTAPPSTTSTPSSSQTPSSTILTPKNNSNSEQVHTGGGYSSSGGYTGTGDYNPDTSTATSNATPATPGTPETVTPGNTSKLTDEELASIKNVIDNSKTHTTTIPKSNTPINSNTKSGGGGSSVIPIAAGLTAAAAAGLGAKAYLDRKNNNDNGSSDEINTDEWTGDDAVDIQYDGSSDTNAGENVLDADDDYSYQPAEETEKYDARSSDELADLQ